MSRLAVVHRRIRRAVLARRRLLAGLCAALAVAVGFQAATAPPPTTTTVLTAARDLPGGTVVHDADLRPVQFVPGGVPEGVLPSAAQAVGRTTAAPIRAGEAITDVRLVSGSLLAGYPGRVAAPVRIGDPGAVDLLKAGDRVDLIAADPQGRSLARTIAADVPVIAVPRRRDPAPTAVQGGLIVVAVPESTARAVATASVASYLSIVITR
jgi:Flp pilus assembly protein CpaB